MKEEKDLMMNYNEFLEQKLIKKEDILSEISNGSCGSDLFIQFINEFNSGTLSRDIYTAFKFETMNKELAKCLLKEFQVDLNRLLTLEDIVQISANPLISDLVHEFCDMVEVVDCCHDSLNIFKRIEF